MKNKKVLGIITCFTFGLPLGVFLHHIPLGLAIGSVAGIFVEKFYKRKDKNNTIIMTNKQLWTAT